MNKDTIHDLQMLVWNSGNAFADMRLLVEGAITLYEDDAESICSLTLAQKDKYVAIAFDTIGTALYDLREKIRSMQLEYMTFSAAPPNPPAETAYVLSMQRPTNHRALHMLYNEFQLYFCANVAYNISVNGGVLMEERLSAIAASQGGVIRTADAVSAGVSKPELATYVQKHGFERISHGIYLSPSAWPDEMYLLQLRCPNTVFSHETALYLLDMTDQEPMQLTVTAKTGYNPSHLSADGIKTYTIKKELFPIGVTQRKTPFGHEVNVYNAERTICDLARSRSQLDPRCMQEALKRYMSCSTRNIPLLLEYADSFHVKNYLKPYLEALLP